MQSRPFHPPHRTLMGPGPSDVPPRVLEALSRPTIGHLDPRFVELMDEVKELLKSAFRTSNRLTFPVSGPGSAGMETCFVNLVQPGDTVVVCRNGVFGGRMAENVERCGAKAVTVDDDWGSPVDPDRLEEVLRRHPDASLVAFVHAETSTGARSDAELLVRIAHDHDCLTIVDTVTSLAGIAVEVDAWGIDAAYSGSQKCLSCVPGLSPVTFGDRAVERIRSRTGPVQSWFMDTELVMGYWDSDSGRSYHHTAPVNSLYALHESLLILHEEGIEASWRRHRRMHAALVAGLQAMGLRMTVDAEWRLPQLNTVTVPEGLDESTVRARLLADHDLEIGAGLGSLAGGVWRIGLMGHSSRRTNVVRCLSALESVLGDLGAPVTTGAAVPAALRTLDAPPHPD